MTSDRLYPSRPIVGVGAVILVREAHRAMLGLTSTLLDDPGVVLVKRRFEPLAGHWSLPGGVLEVGESLAAGVAREVLEETGLVVDVGPIVEVLDRITRDEGGRVRHHYVLIDYLCEPAGGALRAASDVSDAAIVEPERLSDYGTTALLQDVVARAMRIAEQQREPARASVAR